MGLQSNLAKQFKSSAIWSQADWDREWQSWIDDICLFLDRAGRTKQRQTFTAAEWRILNTIQATAGAARRANNMPGLRDALARYRAAAKHFLGIGGQP